MGGQPEYPNLTIYPSPLSSTDTFTGGTQTAWPSQLSSTLSTIAEQLLSVSRAIAQSHRTERNDSASQSAAVMARLDALEAENGALRAEIDALKSAPQIVPVTSEKYTESAGSGATYEELEKKIADMGERMKLEHAQLYARLHNARATASKMTLIAPPTTSGKPPPGFPATRGEFEHLTRERYEAMLKAYGQPLTGDTAAKKEAARVFVGIPSTPL